MLFLQQMTIPDAWADFGGLPDWSSGMLIRLGLDLFSVSVLIRLIYYRIYRKSDLFLTFFVFNFVIFLITYLLNQVQMSIGAAFGLFAVFSMLRYRTEGLLAKDMTYLFVGISIGLISAISRGSLLQLALIHGIILVGVQLLEGNFLFRREYSKPIHYDRIDLIPPDKRPALLQDLHERTGLNIHRVEVQEMDFLKDSARIIIYYYQHDAKHVTHRHPAATNVQTDVPVQPLV